MKSKKLLSLLCVTFLGLAATAFASDGWMTDFDAAKAKAKAEDKPMLLDFTGSDWCGWCIKLDKEVFGEAAFKEYASSELVLVELDFPRGKEQSAELKAQNEKLAKQYGIRGFPTILVLSPDGELIEQTGYQRGGAEAYVEHIKGIVAKQ
ncbi:MULTISPECIES: thioredoxin family protein [unclassified Lentimonas]|uniref:thioredoxin family protein n=1 Tax=unclassified Lentimonas TaxID=2630993 RepID=UPI001327D0F5|nr:MULTISPECIES: thioredoxin family protein [unclassified Lentimonas]CAA6676573.1 Thioredoxin Disulfide Isomerase [Lentimonas sp. CC4]CAA6684763.1 Thioredoxin Disulfide Isomerase [Lentimonas sp. CC6]CAA6692045.1 Thioredoxin Disulfide Isomerase [Lentimonas sp. CC10]CAA6694017.1 Thioredoxin Disulfide Isomerase [Lentimonas sp. CC19]CAA7070270.1 Thioredoxin Disulfide Isomerase [Lentimonas sp. CC11]